MVNSEKRRDFSRSSAALRPTTGLSGSYRSRCCPSAVNALGEHFTAHKR